MDVKNSLFFILLTIILGIATAFLYFYGYYMSFIILNHLQAPWADVFFSKITHLGDGITFTAIFYLIYGHKDISKTLSLILCLIISSLIVQILKNLVFYDWYRPLVIFGENLVNHIKGYEAYGRTFPSGHSTAIFTTIFCIIQWKSWNYIFQMLFFLIGFSVAFSRIYLGVHFLGDVLMGIFIAFVVSFALFKYISSRFHLLNKNSYGKKFLFYLSILVLTIAFCLRVIFEINF